MPRCKWIPRLESKHIGFIPVASGLGSARMLRTSRRAAMRVAALAIVNRHVVDSVGRIWNQEWGVAALGRRPGQHRVLGTRSNESRQRQEPAGGLAVEGGQLRAAAAEQPGVHALMVGGVLYTTAGTRPSVAAMGRDAACSVQGLVAARCSTRPTRQPALSSMR